MRNGGSTRRRWSAIGSLVLLAAVAAHADEGGVGFWLPGTYASFAAVPADPGWSLPVTYYHYGGDQGASHGFVIGGHVTAGVHATADMVYLAPSFTPRGRLLGGSSTFVLNGGFGGASTRVDAKLSGPAGSVLEHNASDQVFGLCDLAPQWTLAWDHGTSNVMTYVMAGIPVGTYDPSRLANIGIRHGAFDAGGGYTYMDTTSGHELSVVAGFTYNLDNPDTHYKNGFDAHLDWAASQFLSKSTHVGVVGYGYDELGSDSGSGAVLGSFRSQVLALGPEIGHFMDVGGGQWYAQLKGYWEFAVRNRPQGWNLWLTLSIPLGPQ